MAEVNELQTDVALIKKDIKQIEKFFNKFDAALDTMSEMSKQVAVQGQVLVNTSEKLHDLEQRVEEHRKEDKARTEFLTEKLEEYRSSSRNDHARLAEDSKQNRKERNEEIMQELSKLNDSLDKRLTILDNRIKILEQWKWYIMGLGGAVVFIVSEMQWPSFFG